MCVEPKGYTQNGSISSTLLQMGKSEIMKHYARMPSVIKCGYGDLRFARPVLSFHLLDFWDADCCDRQGCLFMFIHINMHPLTWRRQFNPIHFIYVLLQHKLSIISFCYWFWSRKSILFRSSRASKKKPSIILSKWIVSTWHTAVSWPSTREANFQSRLTSSTLCFCERLLAES